MLPSSTLFHNMHETLYLHYVEGIDEHSNGPFVPSSTIFI